MEPSCLARGKGLSFWVEPRFLTSESETFSRVPALENVLQKDAYQINHHQSILEVICNVLVAATTWILQSSFRGPLRRWVRSMYALWNWQDEGPEALPWNPTQTKAQAYEAGADGAEWKGKTFEKS
jgi:hypothetical protein